MLERLGPLVHLSAAVRAAHERGRPLVALESSVFAQGLAIPANREAWERMTQAVRRAGAEPAVAALVAGRASMGVEPADMERLLARHGVRKVSARDLAWCAAEQADGATTVAATLALGALAGVSVFATGGIGGVHRDAPFDESADLVELARTPMIVVCAGAKSILDLPATMERLETLGVTVLGYRTGELPGFFTATTGLALSASVQTVADVATVWSHHRALRRPGALLVVQAPPADAALDAGLVEAATQYALARAAEAGVRGGAVTPFLLAEMERRTEGASVTANLALLEANAELAGEIAVAVAGAVAGTAAVAGAPEASRSTPPP